MIAGNNWYLEMRDELMGEQSSVGDLTDNSHVLHSSIATTALAILALESKRIPPGVGLNFTVQSPADICVIDPTGEEHCVTGGDEPKTVDIDNPLVGNYQVRLTGTGTGNCTLVVEGLVQGTAVSSFNRTFPINIDEVSVSTFAVTSAAGPITIEDRNQAPVADAGGDQSVVAGDTVYLDGGGSSDSNLDQLTYEWSFVAMPDSSEAELLLPDATEPGASFVADEPGEYAVRLVVCDGYDYSEPSDVTIVAVSVNDYATEILQEAKETINNLDSTAFFRSYMKKMLTRRITIALWLIDKERHNYALFVLEHWVLSKVDGCAALGSPDEGLPLREFDWIIDCDAQGMVYPLIVEAIELLRDL